MLAFSIELDCGRVNLESWSFVPGQCGESGGVDSQVPLTKLSSTRQALLQDPCDVQMERWRARLDLCNQFLPSAWSVQVAIKPGATFATAKKKDGTVHSKYICESDVSTTSDLKYILIDWSKQLRLIENHPLFHTTNYFIGLSCLLWWHVNHIFVTRKVTPCC